MARWPTYDRHSLRRHGPCVKRVEDSKGVGRNWHERDRFPNSSHGTPRQSKDAAVAPRPVSEQDKSDLRSKWQEIAESFLNRNG